jgi:hypothetical protein
MNQHHGIRPEDDAERAQISLWVIAGIIALVVVLRLI